MTRTAPPFVETSMPKEDVFTFTLRRFRRDLECGLKKALQVSDLPVVLLSTHTDYIDPLTQMRLIQPVVDRKTKEAVVPAVVLTGLSFQEDRTDFNAHKPVRDVTFESSSGQIVSGHEVQTAPSIYELTMDVRLFHNIQPELIRLAAAFQRHFKRHPYLFIPHDRSQGDAEEFEDVNELIRSWYVGSDLSNKGIVIEQMISFTGPSVSIRSSPSSDNLFVADSSVVVSNLPVEDDISLGKFEDVNDIDIEIYDLSDPDQLTLATIDVEET